MAKDSAAGGERFGCWWRKIQLSGKFKFQIPNSKSSIYHLIVLISQNVLTVYDIFDLLEHNSMGKNKCKSYLGTLNLKFKFPAQPNLSPPAESFATKPFPEKPLDSQNIG